ncbi:Chromo domain-containing protein [Cucumis melo var. makuwa]|uniref:Chromo domain-containing protein n=1 Tax=Cucumis melo var. makuwa TaxID=1194695 RepID=A0A5A7SR06_CUCMM|nr:Chromo domain-containing protein [Cucumis melo var. makuwa]TYK21990.1 Chromo domain-containing protein [Cucumis melo var. makuwa]
MPEIVVEEEDLEKVLMFIQEGKMQKKVGHVKRKALLKGLYLMKLSNAIGIDGEKGDALSNSCDTGESESQVTFTPLGVLHFRRKEKLSPRYISLYMITERVGLAAYGLELPAELARIHDIFHEDVVQIRDRKVQVLRNKTITLMKVIWRRQGVEEVTWKSEDKMRSSYPALFA